MARRKDSDEDESNENLGNQKNDSDDTFGLPDIEYKPLSREEEPTSSAETPPASENVTESESENRYQYQSPPEVKRSEYTYVPEEDDSPVWPKIMGILFVIVLALGASLYFVWYKPNQIEKAKLLEKQKLEQEAKQKELDRLALEARDREDAERRKADSLASVPTTGAFETLSERTGRYYVVIASAVDGDLIMDHAKKLSTTGVSTKIIPPFGKFKFYRLTIAEGETYAAAQEIADTKKTEYGEAWVLKY